MALFLKQTEQRSQLQEKIAADLANRTQTPVSDNDPPKADPAMLDNTQQASSHSMVWVAIGTLAVVALVVAVLFIF